MAPSLKELETSVATTTSPAATPTKTANDPTRPQPVALEVPVTVNGARTVEGSDKRVPFSEATQTVLVFPHGAVIRIGAALASGQLVFLTNEKTKKEVVCQVVKSKSTGSTGSYVEVQFTEPAPGFWGVQIPGPVPVPARPAAAGSQPVSKPVAPSATPAPKPPVAAKLVAPGSLPPAKSVVAPPAPAPVIPPAPVTPKSNVVPPIVPSAPAVTPSELSASAVTPSAPSQPAIVPDAHAPHSEPTAKPPAPRTVVPTPAAETHTPAPPLHDYSKEIQALFGSTQPTVTSAPSDPTPARVSSDPSTEDLKLQAARLKEQLGSLLFTEAPAAPKTAATVPPSALKPEFPVAEVVKKAAPLVVHEEQKPAVQTELKAPAAPVRKPVAPALGADEEVKIPSWLAPLSQAASESVPAADTASPTEAAHEQSISVNSEESFDALVGQETRRPQTAVFGGQLLGEASGASADSASTGSKKGLFLGLAAAALVVVGAAGWYFYQSHSNTNPTPATHISTAPVSTEPAVIPAQPTTPAPSSPSVASSVTPAPSPSQPSKKSPPASSPTRAESVPGNNATASAKTPQAVEPEPKPSLGDVHLAAPVVNHTSASQPDSDGLQAIDTKTVPTSADPFSSGTHHPPTAPLPVGGEVKQAQLLKSVAPEYPAIAKSQHISGKVQIDALIDASGNVASLKVISGPALLHHAATDAVKQWKYKPAMLDGQATSMHLTVTVEFRAQ